jgi:hypothetical protein
VPSSRYDKRAPVDRHPPRPMPGDTLLLKVCNRLESPDGWSIPLRPASHILKLRHICDHEQQTNNPAASGQ